MKGSRAVEKEVRLKTPCITLGQLLKISFHRAVRPNTFLKSMPMKFLSTENMKTGAERSFTPEMKSLWQIKVNLS